MKSQTHLINNVYIDSIGIVVGKKEKEGPIGKYFKHYIDDLYNGEKTFELAQSKLASQSIKLALKNSSFHDEEIQLAIGGDLSNQIFSSTAAIKSYLFPFIGVYAACASINLSIIISSLLINSKIIDNSLVYTSSHVGCAEKQFRYPNEYGIQKCLTNTTTITGACSLILSNKKNKIKVSSLTIGKVVDINSKNANDMGTPMAYAAIDTFKTHMQNLNKNEHNYDYILTGDLSTFGSKVFIDELFNFGYDIAHKYYDCGLLIYDKNKQDVNAGGSGPACIGCVAFSYIVDKMLNKEIKRVLLIATGALHSQISYQQKQTIPCIAHAIELEVNE